MRGGSSLGSLRRSALWTHMERDPISWHGARSLVVAWGKIPCRGTAAHLLNNNAGVPRWTQAFSWFGARSPVVAWGQATRSPVVARSEIPYSWRMARSIWWHRSFRKYSFCGLINQPITQVSQDGLSKFRGLGQGPLSWLGAKPRDPIFVTDGKLDLVASLIP